MSNEQTDFQEADSQPVVSKSHKHFNPVVLTDTVGALFLGSISIFLMAVVAGLLVYIRKLETRLSEPGNSVEK